MKHLKFLNAAKVYRNISEFSEIENDKKIKHELILAFRLTVEVENQQMRSLALGLEQTISESVATNEHNKCFWSKYLFDTYTYSLHYTNP